MEFMRKTKLYCKKPRSQAQGAKVIPVRWVRVNKGRADKPSVRYRLVAREINQDV